GGAGQRDRHDDRRHLGAGAGGAELQRVGGGGLHLDSGRGGGERGAAGVGVQLVPAAGDAGGRGGAGGGGEGGAAGDDGGVGGDPGAAAGGGLDADRLAVAAAVGDRGGRRHDHDAGDDEPGAGVVQLLRPPRAAADGGRHGALRLAGRAT